MKYASYQFHFIYLSLFYFILFYGFQKVKDFKLNENIIMSIINGNAKFQLKEKDLLDVPFGVTLNPLEKGFNIT